MKKLIYKSVAIAMAASFIATPCSPALTNVKAAMVKNGGGSRTRAK